MPKIMSLLKVWWGLFIAAHCTHTFDVDEMEPITDKHNMGKSTITVHETPVTTTLTNDLHQCQQNTDSLALNSHKCIKLGIKHWFYMTHSDRIGKMIYEILQNHLILHSSHLA